ncbi:hypothetical protein U0021_08040 [Moraxella canis]|uniref:Uncharacterized protein n=1 Tax=Moraxella canis TaxID=90239 RepID=A0ABZ0WWQ6_9GAMM|nr:hypothetical protein [Moraxella canis]WQE03684.1 hypothetical protein U0021_08040 [Moraxella canis]
MNDKFNQNLQKISTKINAPREALIEKLAQSLQDNTTLTLTLDEMQFLHKELSKTVFIPLLELEDIAKMSK